MNLRFAAVISHPTQHHSPMFRELAKVPGIEVKVFYCCDWGVKPTFDPGFSKEFAWDVPLLEGYNHEFIPIPRRPTKLTFRQVDNPALPDRLAQFRPHALWVHGYGHRSYWRAVRWAKGRSVVIYFGDSELLQHRSWYKRVAKQFVLRRFFQQCQAFITIGDNNESYYAHYGVPRQKMFRGAYPVDVKRFAKALADPARPDRTEIRRRFQLPEDAVVAVFAAKLIPRKRPQDLIEAVTHLRRRGVPIGALMVGDGELRGHLEAQVEQRKLSDMVRFAGFINQHQIPVVLDCADILAITSELDPHPLAVSESLIVGHPIVASDRIGCVGISDSARPGVNALVYPCGDSLALADCLERLVSDHALRASMGKASRDLAPSQDMDTAVAAVLRALFSLRPKFDQLWSDIDAGAWKSITEHLRGLVAQGAAPSGSILASAHTTAEMIHGHRSHNWWRRLLYR